MICTLKVKLLPSQEQHDLLLATMHRFNDACNFASKVAWGNKAFGQVRLHKLCYYDIRGNFGLSAQFAVRTIGRVVELYKADKQRQHHFKPTGAVVYDLFGVSSLITPIRSRRSTLAAGLLSTSRTRWGKPRL